MKPYKEGICHRCRENGDRSIKPLINNLCSGEPFFHYQEHQEGKTKAQLEKETERKREYLAKQLSKQKEYISKHSPSVYIELPSGEKGTLEGKEIKQQAKPFKIKPVSEKRAKQLREYEKEKAVYFEQHPTCEFPGCGSSDITLHHMGGRIGSMLTDSKYFKSLCWFHHKWAEENPNKAKEMELSISRLNKAS